MTAALYPSPPSVPSYGNVRHGGNYMYNYYFPPSPSSTPWAPSWSPDGAAVAVGMSGSIWSIDVETGAATELTRSGRYHSSPTWSPDGRWIVHTSDGGGSIGLEALNVETGESHPLTDDDWIYTDPTFSPDGTRLAYVSTRPNGYFNVYLRGIRDGEWEGAEVAVTSDNSFGSSRLYFGEWDMHISPSWMPDGSELLMVSNRNVALGSGNVLRVPAEADGILRAGTVFREQTLYRARPDVSPDGARFLVSSTRGAADQFNNLYIQPTGGGEPYKLTFFEHDAFHPRWSPDGERIAYISNEDGLPQLELLETFGGKRRRVEITERNYREPMGTLRVTVMDEGSAEPTPARVILYAADGKVWAPTDTYARIAQRSNYPAFHTTGSFSLDLPSGPVDLTVTKGFEREPQRHVVEVKTGAVTELTVRLERLEGPDLTGWYSGSTHIHMNYGGNLHNTPERLMMMSDAEDLDIVNPLVANKDNRILDHQFFSGGVPHGVSTPERLLTFGQECRPPFYGHVFMIGLTDHLISPFTTGYEGTAIESLFPSNTDMLLKAKGQGAVTGYVHPFNGDGDPLQTGLGGGKGFMVDAALQAADALEWSTSERAGFIPLYALWNNDVRIVATGGEDSISNLHWTPLVGAMRSYVRTADGQLSVNGWNEALRNGHAFVTNGPIVSLTVNGQFPGDEIALPTGGGTLEVEAEVSSVVPLTRVWLVAGGEEVVEIPLSEDGRSASLSTVLTVTESEWIHLRAEGERDYRFPLDASYPQAFTNPVWFVVGGESIRDRASALYGLEWIDALEEMTL